MLWSMGSQTKQQTTIFLVKEEITKVLSEVLALSDHIIFPMVIKTINIILLLHRTFI